MAELKLEIWPLSRISPYAANPRKNDHAVERMCAAIREFGFRIPLVVRGDGELVDGHLRLKAALALGLETAPVLLADDLSPDQVRAFRLLANRSATWASFDEELLAREIEHLMLSGFDVSFTGFEQSELDRLIREQAAVENDPEAVPDPPDVPVVKNGDLWRLGRHRLLCDDSLSGAAMEYLLKGNKVDMVWTDPPYNVDYTGKAGSIKNDKMSAPSFEDFLYTAFVRMREALRPGAAIYVAHSEAGNGLAFRQAFT